MIGNGTVDADGRVVPGKQEGVSASPTEPNRGDVTTRGIAYQHQLSTCPFALAV